MALPRYAQVSLSDTPWYHVVSRCVRRAFLCGVDQITGQSYEHRRDWIEQRILQLAGVFTIDVASYAIMHNHYHIVLRVDNERVARLSTQEVITRWSQLYCGPLIIRRYLSDTRQEMSQGELLQVDKLADEYRQRLCDLSWFMKNLNEFISRKANAEENTRGHFWESRYKCQALLDEPALLAAMAYVDLNPVRAAMSDIPEASDHTAIKRRVAPNRKPTPEVSINTSVPTDSDILNLPEAPLLPFDPAETFTTGIPFSFDDYLALIDTVGRAVHPNKRGFIPDKTPAILHRLNISTEAFILNADQFLKRFGTATGHPAKLIDLAASRNVRYLRGIAKSRAMFGKVA
ncbi:transposase [Desulfuromonas thiophila]|uniref:transposase n=1 Tax=Desulfuromonas thiophila TaxID=57664 RepID=UPI0024A90DDF|nr:transposase [Desulfuromonas thiophila]